MKDNTDIGWLELKNKNIENTKKTNKHRMTEIPITNLPIS